MSKKYYKLVVFTPLIGAVIDTNSFIDYERVKRFKKLTKLFELMYNCSTEFELPLFDILFQVKANFFKRLKFKIKNIQLKKRISEIRNECFKKCFRSNEFRMFNDYMLAKVRDELNAKFVSDLPNRFESCYFFESIDDSLKYYSNLPVKYHTKIIEVEFIQIRSINKFDNTFLSEFQDYYTSDDFYLQANQFLFKHKSDKPLFEIVFQGKYKVIRHIAIS